MRQLRNRNWPQKLIVHPVSCSNILRKEHISVFHGVQYPIRALLSLCAEGSGSRVAAVLPALHSRRSGAHCTSPRRRGFPEVVPCAGIILARLQGIQWSVCLQPGLSIQIFRLLLSVRAMEGNKDVCWKPCVYFWVVLCFSEICVCVSCNNGCGLRDKWGKKILRDWLDCSLGIQNYLPPIM